MVASLINLEHRARAEIVADHETALELGQHAVHGGKPHFLARGQQNLVHVLGGHVPDLASSRMRRIFRRGERGFEADFLEIGAGCVGSA